MSQKELIRFINNHFDEGKNQDEVRQLAQRHAVSEEAYAQALRAVLSQRLAEESAPKGATASVVLGVLAVVLGIAGFVVLTALHGTLAAWLGGALVVLGLIAAVLSVRFRNRVR